MIVIIIVSFKFDDVNGLIVKGIISLWVFRKGLIIVFYWK